MIVTRWESRGVRRLLLVCAVSVLVLTAAPATARPADDDLSVFVFLAQGLGVKQVTGLTFQIRAEIEGSTGALHPVTLRIALPSGLRWGTDGPDPSEGCTGDAPATCTLDLVLDGAGTARAGWEWNVLAAQPGTYEITATGTSSEPDPNQQNNTSTLRFDVLAAPAAGGGGGGGGGGAAAVSASAARISPAKPRAGSKTVVSVRVTRGGAPVRPTAVRCSATAGGVKVAGAPRAASGVAACQFRTPKTAKGKRLVGVIAFRAGASSFTKRFAAKLG